MATKQGGALQVAEQVEFTWRFGTVQRIGWAVMVLVVLMGLAGFSGAGGPFSRRALGAAEVPSVMRAGRVDHMTIYRESGPDAALGPLAGDWLDIGHGTPAGAAGERIVLPITPRKIGIAKLQFRPDREKPPRFRS